MKKYWFLISFIVVSTSFVYIEGYIQKRYTIKKQQQQSYSLFSLNVINNKKNYSNGPSTLRFDELKSSEVMFVKSIRNRSQEKTVFSKDERKEVLSLLSHHLPKMSASNFVNAAFSLSIIYETAKLAGNTEKSMIFEHLPRIIHFLNENDMALLIVAAAKLNTEWSLFKSNKQFEKQLEISFQTMNSKNLGDVIWGIGAMGAQWIELPLSLRHSIIQRLATESNKLNLYQLPSILWAFAKMGAKWNAFDTKTQIAISSVLMSKDTEKLTPQQASKILWGCGGIGLTIDLLPIQFLNIYLSSVNDLKKSKMGFAFSASQTLTGLAKMNVKWESTYMSSLSKAIIWEQLLRVCQGSNNQGLSNAVWAVGSIGVPIDEQETRVQSTALWSNIAKALKLCTGWELTNMIWGLSKMKVKWSDLSEEMIENISTAITRLTNAMNPVDVAIFTYALGSMEAPLDSLRTTALVTSLFDFITESLPNMQATQISKVIWGLSCGGLSWEELPAQLRWQLNVALRREGHEMTPYDLANSAYALALLAFDNQTPSDPAFRGVHEVLLENMLKVQKKYDFGSVSLLKNGGTSKQRYFSIEEIEQLRIFSHYLNVMRHDISTREKIPIGFLVSETDPSSIFQISSSPVFGQKKSIFSTGSSSNSNNNHNHDIIIESTFKARSLNQTSSRLQSGIIDEINEALIHHNQYGKFRVVSEASSFQGVFPVDAAIYYENELICIVEVDGPQHYRYDGKIRRKDKLKEAMYQKQHPECSIQRIRWDVANKVGSEAIGMEVIREAMNSSKKVNILNKVWKSFERNMGDFFNWSMRNSKV